jgi:hypothetical protein
MTIASIHTQGDADALEHLLSKPTYLGATETNGRAACETSNSIEHRIEELLPMCCCLSLALVICRPTESCPHSFRWCAVHAV